MGYPDYAKEIAKRALAFNGQYDGDLLSGIARYCIAELGTMRSTNLIVQFLDELRVEVEEGA